MLNQNAIRRLTTPETYTKGQEYYRTGSIIDAVRRDNVLEATCRGSELYRVTATLNANDDVINATCTCPYDWGGYCKHIIALLLTYFHKPERFAAPVENVLQERSKEDLTSLIQQMITLHPDLKTLIEQPEEPELPAADPNRMETLRADLHRAFYDDSSQNVLDSMRQTAQQCITEGDWRSASAIYQTILDEGLQVEGRMLKTKHDLLGTLNQVLAELADLLKQPTIVNQDSERRVILNQLLEAYIRNVEAGGVGLGADLLPEVLLTYARPADLVDIRHRIEQAQRRKTRNVFAQWDDEAYDHLLAQLDALISRSS
jgi:uncharacterized Zn finger protein